MIYSIAILVKSLELKKSMKELDYSSNFWSRFLYDFLDSPKKFGGLGAPPLMISGTPKIPKMEYGVISTLRISTRFKSGY